MQTLKLHADGLSGTDSVLGILADSFLNCCDCGSESRFDFRRENLLPVATFVRHIES